MKARHPGAAGALLYPKGEAMAMDHLRAGTVGARCISRRSCIEGALAAACVSAVAAITSPSWAMALPSSASPGTSTADDRLPFASKASSRLDGEWSSASSSRADALASSAKEAGTTAESNRTYRYEDIPQEAFVSADELYELVQSGAVDRRESVILDIRSHRDFQNQMIAGSRNIPAGRQIDIRMDEIPRDKPVILVALKSSNRLAETWYTLVGNGFDPSLVKVLSGGLSTWIDAGYPTLEDQFLGC